MPQKHSRLTEHGRYIWYTERLWQLAHHLPVRSVTIASIAEFDQNCWFDSATPPTCRAVARHARQIFAADLSYPIILSAEGYLMDGGHRLAKAWLLGHTHIPAIQFDHNPEPDHIIPPDT